jgi:ABC-type transport system involved in Fe-S cluster assembly fused permease/ATPase subunit
MEADAIIYLQEGQIRETGTHDDLMKKKNGYYALWNTNYVGVNALQ